MPNIIFLHPVFLIGIPLTFIASWFYYRLTVPIEHSNVAEQKNLSTVGLLTIIPLILFGLALSAGCVALSRPVMQKAPIVKQVPAIDVFIAADISDDMDDPSNPDDPNSMTEDKLSALTPTFFVEHMQDSRIALATFATKTYIYWPFSTDQKVLRLVAKEISNLSKSAESESYDAPTGPLQTAINMFTKYSQAKSKVFVLVTDGDADGFIKSEANTAMINELQKMGVHMYLIVIGSDGPFSVDTALVRFVNSFGEHGHVIRGISPEQMNEAAVQIAKLERTSVDVESTPQYKDIYLVFVAGFVVLLLLAMLSRALLRQTV
jgi:hypothetical protein